MWAEHVDALLVDVNLQTVPVASVGAFDSPYPGDPYKCIVAHFDVASGPPLRKAHAWLLYLPQVNTFPEYRACVTFAYVEDEPASVDWVVTLPEEWVPTLNGALSGATTT